MKRTITGLLLAGVLGLALAVQTACIQQTPWEKANAAGMEAYQQARYGEAKKWWFAALEEAENFGPDDQRLATSLNNLGLLYQTQGKYAQAEPLYKRSLAIWEKGLGSEHPQVAIGLNNLAALYQAQGRYAQAEPFFQRSLAILEKVLGPAHPHVAQGLNNLAALYVDQGKYAQAEPFFQRSLAIREKVLGPEHPHVAQSLNNLAALYR